MVKHEKVMPTGTVRVRVNTYTLVFGLYRMCWRREKHSRTELIICLPLFFYIYILYHFKISIMMIYYNLLQYTYISFIAEYYILQ